MARESDYKMSSTTSDVEAGRAARRDWDDEERHEYRRVMSAGTLKGDRVRNSAGEDLGKLEEIMLDIPTGRIAYAVLSFGGFLGMGSKLFAVPWESLTLNERDHEFAMNVDKKVLENAPGFDKDNWPDMADPKWGSEIFAHYGQKPYWETQRTEEVDRREREGTFERGEKKFDKDRNRTLSGGGGL